MSADNTWTIIGAMIAALGSLATAIIMLITYRKQNTLFNLQIQHYEGNQLERLRHYYRETATKLQGFIKTNESLISKIEGKIFNDWDSLKLHYSGLEETNNPDFRDALTHITKEIPDFIKKIDAISNKVKKLNLGVEDLKQSKVERVKRKMSLYGFQLTGDPPYIMKIIENYWFLDMLTVYFKGQGQIKDIIDMLRPLSMDQPRGKFRVKTENGIISFSSNEMCKIISPNSDQDRFMTSYGTCKRRKNLARYLRFDYR